MGTVKVAALQLDPVWEDPAASHERAGVLLAEAAAQGAELAVLPEMFATGFTMRADLAAGAGPDSEAYLADAARAYGLWICAGLVLPGRVRPRNSAILLDPDGARRLRYDKLQPFGLAGESSHYEAGDAMVGLDIGGLRCCPLICYDLRFPELFRLRSAQTDLFLLLASWPAARSAHWRSLLQARAIENQAYVLGVNRSGEGGGLAYGGGSCLIDPDGVFVFEADALPGAHVAQVAAEAVAAQRARLPFLADRRALQVDGLG